METQGVALGYVGDKIRYILIIRVRLTSEFFFEQGFIGLTRMFRYWRYCLPDSYFLLFFLIPRLRPGLLSLRSVLASSQILLARFMVIINSRNGH